MAVILERKKKTQKHYNSAVGMLKKARVETHMQRETDRQKQTGRRVFLHLSIHEEGVQTGGHR